MANLRPDPRATAVELIGAATVVDVGLNLAARAIVVLAVVMMVSGAHSDYRRPILLRGDICEDAKV